MQRKHLENWARWRGIELLSVFEELDLAGAGPDRPLLAAAIARIEDGVSDGLAVWSVERFHPSFLDGLLLIERVRTAGGQLYSVEAALTPPLIAAARSRAAGSRTPSPSSTAYAQAGTRAAPTRSASVLSKPRLSLTPLSTRSCCSPQRESTAGWCLTGHDQATLIDRASRLASRGPTAIVRCVRRDLNGRRVTPAEAARAVRGRHTNQRGSCAASPP